MSKSRRSVILARFENYINESIETKEHCQDLLFEIYYERNDFEIELTLEEIRDDMIRLAHAERYERCQMLKDILQRFE